MSILDALKEYDQKVGSMIQNLRNGRDLLVKENSQLRSQLQALNEQYCQIKDVKK